MEDPGKSISSLSPAKRALLNLRLQVDGASSAVPATIVPRDNSEFARVSFAQERLWFLNQLEPKSASYNVPRIIRLRGSLNINGLERTLHEIVVRHESLRTHFRLIDGTLIQVIDSVAAIPLPLIDISELSAINRNKVSLELAKREAVHPFDLTRDPIVRARLVKISPGEHLLLLTMHHIVSDAWSSGLFLKELAQLYDAFAMGKASPLAPLTIQYADFAEWQRDWLQGEVLEEQLLYWRKQLFDAPTTLDLPTDHLRPDQLSAGATRSTTISHQLYEQIRDVSRREGATLFMTLLAAFNVLLYRYSGQDDIVVGTPIAGRNRAEIEDLIGFFVNTLALRIDLSGNPTFRVLLHRVKEVALQAYDHQDLPFEKLVEELRPERDSGRNPFFQVMFQLQNAPKGSLKLQGLELTTEAVESETTKFDLSLGAFERDGELRLRLEYSTELFERQTIELMLSRYATLLESIVLDPECRIANLSLMTEAERRQLLVTWNDAESGFETDESLPGIFERQAEKTPGPVALVAGEERISYRELNARANQLAHYLRKRGVGAEVAVGICLERSVEMVVGLLAILKAGGAYVPLDPSHPSERLNYVLEDCGARVLLTKKGINERLSTTGCAVVVLDTEGEAIALESETNPESNVHSENAAYVIYTSGSTGNPKGVVGRHRATINRLSWMWDRYPFASGEICCQKTALGFVDSIWEIFGPLLQGTPLVIIEDEEVRDPSRFLARLGDTGVTRIVLVPSLLRVLLQQGQELQRRLAGLKIWVCSGEALPSDLAESFRRELPGSLLINLYGSSEVAADVTCYEVSSNESASGIPLGRPIANTQIYILDRHLEPVPSGMDGEIYVGGEGLARGYLNRPELTAEKFIANPFSSVPGARLYKTGDIGRFRSDGNIEYRGRRDHQVKIRGSRIELGEVQAALVSHPQIGESIVQLAEDRSGDKRLIAYVSASGKPPSSTQLRSYLRHKLPEYMLPSAFVFLDKFPLTPSGKVNRLALPPVDHIKTNERDYLAPRTITEEIVVGILAEVLGVEEVSINDDFFELGGHSLLLIRVMCRLEEVLNIQVPMRVLFENSKVSRLAESIENIRELSKGSRKLPLFRAFRDGQLPLSFAQESLWVFEQLEPGTGAYNISRALRLIGNVSTMALQESIDRIAARHETLRATFRSKNGAPVQDVAETPSVTLTLLDLSDLPAGERNARAGVLVREDSQRPFDLETGPLIRINLLRLAEEEHFLVVTMHHIISDGWSVAVFFEEFVSSYNSLISGRDMTLPELPIQYADYAIWQRQTFNESELESSFAYWSTQLEGAPSAVALPKGRSLRETRTHRGAKLTFEISNEVTQALKKLARLERMTLFMTLLAGFKTLLWWYSSKDDVVVGSPSVGRDSDTESLIGHFVKTLVLRTRLSGDPEFCQVMHRVRETTLGALTHQDVPYEKLIERFRPERTLSLNPLFQAWFVLQNGEAERRDFQDLTVESYAIENEFTRHDLQLTLWETSSSLKGAFTYSTDLFDRENIAEMVEQFRVLLALVTSQPDIPLSALRTVLDQNHKELRKRIEEALQNDARRKLRAARRRSVSEINFRSV
jgi:amino acid adenylation domain-containing protein